MNEHHAEACGNCGAALTGPYCAQCGQHAHGSSRSVAVVLHEAWHLFTHVDGRLWLGLKTLVLRPGKLTLEYFAGKRAKYLPPFQLYFIVSIVLFALPSLLSHVGVHKETAAQKQSELSSVQKELKEDPELKGSAAVGALNFHADGDGTVSSEFTPADCNKINTQPPWLRNLMVNSCLRHAADHGRSLIREFVAAIPRMMFIFLPLMAAVMMLLYLRQHRYYVEHLVYFLNVHAALFILAIVNVLFGVIADFLPFLAPVSNLLGVILFFYSVWYVYRSMRRFYGQGRAKTIVKLTVVTFAYFSFLVLTLLSTLAMTALFG